MHACVAFGWMTLKQRRGFVLACMALIAAVALVLWIIMP